MNILDADISELQREFAGADKLETLYKLQERLLRNGWSDSDVLQVSLTTHAGQEKLRGAAYFLIEELMEGMNALKNRAWTGTETEPDVLHFKEEMADAMHFFIELLIFAGISPAELTELFMKKHTVNLFRQRSGY